MKFLVLPAAVLFMLANSAEATPLNNDTGLPNPGHVIDFDSNGLAVNASLDTTYISEGVTFTNIYKYGNASFPNMSLNGASNVNDGPLLLPFTISFNHIVAEAAFAMITDESSTPTVIETFLNGILVESASVFGNVFNTNNFYGFTNSLFDEIKVTPETTQSGGALIDNLQFTLSDATPPDGTPTDVPEPMSLALLSSGLIGVGLIRRRRR